MNVRTIEQEEQEEKIQVGYWVHMSEGGEKQMGWVIHMYFWVAEDVS